MENFKAISLTVIAFAVVGIVGYWAVVTVEPGDVSLYKQKLKAAETSNEELQKEVSELKSELALLKSREEADKPAPIEPAGVVPAEKPAPTQTSKYQSLINELQKLVDGNIFMKVGSRGTRVGTIQTFLNIYNKTSKKVDNDYGPGLKTDIMNFQKAVGVTADGETGSATYKKMIEWLKKQ